MTADDGMSDPDYLAGWIREYGSAPKLLREHVDDGSGKCTRCSAGGDSSGRVAWPCSLRLAAEKAG